MNRTETMTVQTTKGELRYYRDWNYEGGIVMENPQTIERYKELNQAHPDADKCGVFFAFSQKQFDEGYQKLISLGHIKDGDKIFSMGAGGYGTKRGIDEFLRFYNNKEEIVKEECDPQEVYFYEYNNHESMISWDGDLEAIKLIIRIYGADVARKIKRHNASASVETLIRKPIEVAGLFFNYNGERKQPSSLYFSNQLCYTMYDNTLSPVYDSNGKPYASADDLQGISASYDGKTIYNFHVE